MVMFYEELRKSLPPADALYAAQMRMRRLTEDDLLDIVDEVQQHFIHGDADEFVMEPMDLIEQLKEQRYWAAFVLTGYGSRALYHSSPETR
jgi:CHAT domain-containing protein